MNSSKSIVFITGTFLSNSCWDEWKSFFESKGYHCIAPAWPHKNASAEDLRNRHPDAAIASLRLPMLIVYYSGIIHALPQKPILIGHSLGGLIVQLLLQQGLAAAGIAIHSFPPQNAGRFNFHLLKALWEVMGFFTDIHQSYMMPFRNWKRSVANGITCDQQKELYYRYALPESKQVSRDLFSSFTNIDFKSPHAPLLLTSGTADEIVPAPVNYGNYRKYSRDDSITNYKEFAAHNHLVFGESLWMEEADFILYWLQGINP